MINNVKTDFDWMIDDARARVLEAILPDVMFDGWSEDVLLRAITNSGVPEANAKLAFPRGLIDVVSEFHKSADREFVGELPNRIALMTSIGQKIKTAVMLRFEIAGRNKDAVRRAAAYFALPHHAVTGTQLLWGTVDQIWQSIGVEDKGVTYYTRRGSLAAIYSATLMFWLQDESDDLSAAADFLDRRLADQMRFGKITSAIKSPFQKKN